MLPGALENYHEQMFQTFMVNASTFQCLNSECGAVGLLEKTAPGFPNVVCSACKQRHCALCTVTWHEDMSCQAYRAKNHKELVSSEEKAALRMLAKLGAKRCPRCQLAVDKDGGCNSMYCKFTSNLVIPLLFDTDTGSQVPTAGDTSTGLQQNRSWE
jgi:hypothetical protein